VVYIVVPSCEKMSTNANHFLNAIAYNDIEATCTNL
jgi:hypothetical protein